MVSLFLARQDPAGRELKPSDQSLPNDSMISDTVKLPVNLNDSVPRDVPPADDDPATGGDSTSTPTTPAPSPDVPTTTNVTPKPAVVPDSSPDLNNPQLTTIDTPGQNTSPSEPITDQNQGPINQDRQSSSNPGDGGPKPDSGSSDPGAQGDVPVLPLQSEGGFIPSTASNGPQPTTTQTISNPPASNTVTLPTNTLQTAPTAPSTQGGTLSTGLSDNQKYIIGGAVGGGVFLLILLVLLLVCCRKRRAKKDLECAGDGQGKTGNGQFSCCNHGTCNKNHAPTPMGERTPLRPFALKPDPAVLITKEPSRQRTVSFKRRDSTGSQKSAGSDAGSGESEYSDGSSQRGKKGLLKRPPPLKLTSLVTPVINGPQDNPRDKGQRTTLHLPEVPSIVVESPRSQSPPDRMRRRY